MCLVIFFVGPVSFIIIPVRNEKLYAVLSVIMDFNREKNLIKYKVKLYILTPKKKAPKKRASYPFITHRFPFDDIWRT